MLFILFYDCAQAHTIFLKVLAFYLNTGILQSNLDIIRQYVFEEIRIITRVGLYGGMPKCMLRRDQILIRIKGKRDGITKMKE